LEHAIIIRERDAVNRGSMRYSGILVKWNHFGRSADLVGGAEWISL